MREGRAWSGGGVSGVRSLTWCLSLPIYRPFSVSLSVPVALCLFLGLLVACIPESLGQLQSGSLFLCLFRIFVPPFLARGRAVAESLSALSRRAPGLLLHLPVPSRRAEELRTLPTLAPGPPASSRPATFGRRGSLPLAPGPGPPWRRESALPGPRLPVGWVRRGIRSGEHWLHKGRERPGPGCPSSARAGLCNG